MRRRPLPAFPFEQLNGCDSGTIEFYQILTGEAHTGYRLGAHERDLPLGGIPHAPHRHVHERRLSVREDEMEGARNGKRTRLGLGSCAYMASSNPHGYRKSPNAAAKYFRSRGKNGLNSRSLP